MDFALTDAQELIRKEVSTLAKTFDWEYWREKDRKAEYPSEFVQAFADAGWLGLAIPEAYGGAGLGVTEAVLMLEAICASGVWCCLAKVMNARLAALSISSIPIRITIAPLRNRTVATPMANRTADSPRNSLGSIQSLRLASSTAPIMAATRSSEMTSNG